MVRAIDSADFRVEAPCCGLSINYARWLTVCNLASMRVIIRVAASYCLEPVISFQSLLLEASLSKGFFSAEKHSFVTVDACWYYYRECVIVVFSKLLHFSCYFGNKSFNVLDLSC